MKALNLLSKLTVAAVVMTVFTIGCDGISNPEPINTMDSTRTATIQGAALANLDLTNDTTETGTPQVQYESVPEGTTVKVTFDSRPFASNIEPGVDYPTLTRTTTVDASGNYSIEVPAPNEPLDVTVYLDAFSATQIQSDDSEETRTFIPGVASYQITVVEGLTFFGPDITYIAN